MAKRLTDTELSRKAWFRKLSPKMKCAWRFICDECDQAGIWSIDTEALAFFIGENISLQEMIDSFTADKESRVEIVDKDKLFIPGFIEFQYSTTVEGLNPDNKVHLSVIKKLKKLGAYKPLASPLEGAKDKDKDKDKDKEEGGVGETTPRLATIWNEHCGLLPKVESCGAPRIRSARARWKEKPDEVYWASVIKRISASDFCNGKSKEGWIATFDFLLKPETANKTLEGTYDNRGGTALPNKSLAEQMEEFHAKKAKAS